MEYTKQKLKIIKIVYYKITKFRNLNNNNNFSLFLSLHHSLFLFYEIEVKERRKSNLLKWMIFNIYNIYTIVILFFIFFYSYYDGINLWLILLFKILICTHINTLTTYFLYIICVCAFIFININIVYIYNYVVYIFQFFCFIILERKKR